MGWSTALIREYTHIHTHIFPTYTRTQTWGPASRFASVPLADGQVWFATLPRPSTSSSSSTDENAHSLLLDHFRRWHDPIPALLAATPPAAILRDDAVAHRVFPPFNSEHQSQPSSWPVTLVGDAAHGVDPILAQGAGVAVEDAYHLAGALGGLEGGKDGALDVGAALRCVNFWVSCLSWVVLWGCRCLGVGGVAQLSQLSNGRHTCHVHHMNVHQNRGYEAATRGRAELLTLVSDLSQVNN